MFFGCRFHEGRHHKLSTISQLIAWGRKRRVALLLNQLYLFTVSSTRRESLIDTSSVLLYLSEWNKQPFSGSAFTIAQPFAVTLQGRQDCTAKDHFTAQSGLFMHFFRSNDVVAPDWSAQSAIRQAPVACWTSSSSSIIESTVVWRHECLVRNEFCIYTFLT